MNILELIQGDGFQFKKVASTRGGEYHGPCPFCGGNDRFRIQPARDFFKCRACEKFGDSVQYLRDFRGMSYFDALIFLDREPDYSMIKSKPILTPKVDRPPPPELWQARASSIAMQSAAILWGSAGDKMRAWLRTEKGLSDATIKKAGLGFNPSDLFEPRATWGLPPALNEKGNPSKVKLPAGLVIPFLQGDKVHRLRIRLTNPDDDDDRYKVVRGSYMAPMILRGSESAVVVVESELDAILLNQEAGDLVTMIALGSVSYKPDTQADRLLKVAKTILIALDSDEAGAKAAWSFWPKQYGRKVKRWPCLLGKDPSEARLNGLDLRTWIQAGLPDIPPEENKRLVANLCEKSSQVNDSKEEQVDISLRGKEKPPPEPSPPINADDQELIDWFLTATLPTQPFNLDSARRVSDPVKFFAAIRQEIESRQSSPRWRCGATQADLRSLKLLLSKY